MTLTEWEAEVLARPGAQTRVAEIEARILVAELLHRARKKAKVSQREVARRMDISQPRVAAIEGPMT